MVISTSICLASLDQGDRVIHLLHVNEVQEDFTMPADRNADALLDGLGPQINDSSLGEDWQETGRQSSPCSLRSSRSAQMRSVKAK